MTWLVFGKDEIVIPWICNQLDMQPPLMCASIGIAKETKLIGAALYHNQNLDMHGKPLFIEISFATIDARWANRHTINALLSYPFRQLKVKRLQATVSKRNKRVRLFLEHLGFKLEGIGRFAWPQGGHAAMYSLLSEEFFSSKWNIKIGQKQRECAVSTRSECNNSSANSSQ